MKRTTIALAAGATVVGDRRQPAREVVGEDHGRVAGVEDVAVARAVLVEPHRAVEPALLARQHDEQRPAETTGLLVGGEEESPAMPDARGRSGSNLCLSRPGPSRGPASASPDPTVGLTAAGDKPRHHRRAVPVLGTY
jgi:hypothetical protein